MKRTRVLAPIARMSQRKRILANIDRRLAKIDLAEDAKVRTAVRVAKGIAGGDLQKARAILELTQRFNEDAEHKRVILGNRRNRVLGRRAPVE